MLVFQIPTADAFVRHMCENGCMAWLGHPGDPDLWPDVHMECEYCGTSRFKRVHGALQPRRTFYLFSVRNAIRDWFSDQEFCDALHSHNRDVSSNNYLSSEDFKRIDAGGPGWPQGLLSHPDTILVAVSCDAVTVHDNATQGYTGMVDSVFLWGLVLGWQGGAMNSCSQFVCYLPGASMRCLSLPRGSHFGEAICGAPHVCGAARIP